jgi:hypothetical protein
LFDGGVPERYATGSRYTHLSNTRQQPTSDLLTTPSPDLFTQSRHHKMEASLPSSRPIHHQDGNISPIILSRSHSPPHNDLHQRDVSLYFYYNCATSEIITARTCERSKLLNIGTSRNSDSTYDYAGTVCKNVHLYICPSTLLVVKFEKKAT